MVGINTLRGAAVGMADETGYNREGDAPLGLPGGRRMPQRVRTDTDKPRPIAGLPERLFDALERQSVLMYDVSLFGISAAQECH